MRATHADDSLVRIRCARSSRLVCVRQRTSAQASREDEALLDEPRPLQARFIQAMPWRRFRRLRTSSASPLVTWSSAVAPSMLATKKLSQAGSRCSGALEIASRSPQPAEVSRGANLSDSTEAAGAWVRSGGSAQLVRFAPRERLRREPQRRVSAHW